jgi:FixJ family two-component response regulator
MQMKDPKVISVVDDDAAVCRSTALLIESFGYRTAAFQSAESFLNFGQRQDTCCLVLDVQMPGMNGLELQSQLTAEGCTFPIIFMTAFHDKESCRRAMEGGAVALLAKPYGDEQLLETIRVALTSEGSTEVLVQVNHDEYVH